MQSTLSRVAPDTPDGMAVTSALDVAQLAWQGVPGCPGVTVRELSDQRGTVVALIRYEKAATTPGPAHPITAHHIWIVSGSASIGGRRLAAGSYVNVPPGVIHPITAIGLTGCTLLQVAIPQTAGPPT